MWSSFDAPEKMDIAALAGWAKLAPSKEGAASTFIFTDEMAHYIGLGVQAPCHLDVCVGRFNNVQESALGGPKTPLHRTKASSQVFCPHELTYVS
jgi:hypothetical protein